MTIKKALFIAILLLINCLGIGLIGISFLGASNANGEGAPLESEATSFLKRLLFVAIVGFLGSILTITTTWLFRNKIDYRVPGQIKLFLIQFCFLIAIFIAIYLFVVKRVSLYN